MVVGTYYISELGKRIVEIKKNDVNILDTELYSAYEEDSDTDDEEGQKKLARSSNYLFNNNSSEEEDSDSDDSSTNEDEGLELTPECNVDSCMKTFIAIKLIIHIYQTLYYENKCLITVGPLGRESIKSNDVASYITIAAEDKLNIVVTRNLITVVDIIMNEFQQAASGIPIVPTSMNKLNLQNSIGHESRIELLVPGEVNTYIQAN